MATSVRTGILLVATSIPGLCGLQHAYAQALPDPRTIRWRVYEVNPISNCSPDRTVCRPVALNDCGEVVGQIISTSSVEECLLRPFVWTLCENAYGFDRSLELGDYADVSGAGAGLDINNLGYVAGWMGGEGFFEHSPFVWNLNSYGTSNPKGFQIGDGIVGEARGLNESAAPAFVGFTYVVEASPPSETWTPFRWSYDENDPETLIDLPLVSGDISAIANAVNTPEGSEDLVRIGGISIGEPSMFQQCPIGDVVDDGADWEWDSSSTTVAQLPEQFTGTPSGFDLWRASANAVNQQGEFAGWRVNPESVCLQRATFWESDGAAVDLGDLSPLQALGQTECRGMTDSNSLSTVVVGADLVFQEAVIWWRPSVSSPPADDFEVILASDLHIRECLGEYTEFNDVNEQGWIVGMILFEGLPGRAGVILVPDPCPTDLNSDGVTDSADLAILLGAWGSCASTCGCVADIDASDSVGAADLAVLLGQFSVTCDPAVLCAAASCGDSAESLQSQQSAFAEAASGIEGVPVAVQAVLAYFGQPSLASLGTWIGSLEGSQLDAALDAIEAMLGQ